MYYLKWVTAFSFSLILTACDSGKDTTNTAEEKTQAQQKTVIEPQLQALKNAKEVAKKLEEAQKKRKEQID